MKKLLLCILTTLGLSACVSGINNGSMPKAQNSKVVTEYPIETALINIYAKARSQTLVATVDREIVTINSQSQPKGEMRFEGKSVQGTQITSMTEVNVLNDSTTTSNQLLDQSVIINYFTINPFIFHGSASQSGEYKIMSQTTTIPKMASVGETHLLLTKTVYLDSSKRKQTGAYSQSWSLKQASANSAWLCINTSDNKMPKVASNGTSAECYQIDAQGEILSSRWTSVSANPVIALVFNSQ